MPIYLKEHLYQNYAGKEENATYRGVQATHLTLHAGRSYAQVRQRVPREHIFGRSSRPSSIHIYDIAENTFTLELRNIPMSLALEQFISQEGGEIDNGQNHGTFRLDLRSWDTRFLRELAELSRRVPRDGKIDKFSGHTSEAYAVHRALMKLTGVLEAFHLRNIQTAAIVDPQARDSFGLGGRVE